MSPEATDRRAIITEALRKIDDLSKKLEVAESSDTEPIAVIGVGCRLPGEVNNPDDYWDLLTQGRSGVVRVPANRWDADEFYSEDHTVPGTIVNREGGFLTHWDPDEFDAEFFGITPREATGMDPQQRLLMEVAWEAIEDAGITPKSLRGSQTGVYVGITTNDYMLSFAGKLPLAELDPYIPFGNAANFAAGRLSYFLGLNGPAVVTDTACSSSLVAIHLACQGLRRRETDSALAAGVNLNLSPENSIACSRWGMLAPDGVCKTFDAAANGYVRSEGCGVVVLKRLSDATRDGDRVLAVIRGTGVNQDGASSGQTVPNGPAQQALIRQVLTASKLNPAQIDYVEAHGTGTPLGDPIELDALHAVFGDRGDRSPLIIGSVKTNLGHLESASGIAGFIKTVLAVKNSHIPRQLHFNKLNTHAGAGAARFTVAATAHDWPATGEPRRAGVSSFGVSGTNAHIVVEQAPHVSTEATPDRAVPAISTLVISAKTPERVASFAAVLAEWLETVGANVPLASVAATLAHHRASYPTFATVTATDHRAAVDGLRAVAGGYRAPGVVPVHDGTCRPGTVFVYSGQGSQWAGMGRRLLEQEPDFAAAVAALESDFIAQVGFSLRDTIASGETVTGIDRIQPVLVGIQLALTALWRSRGVVPSAVIGHSMGEVAAAVVAGALSVADGLKVIATRSRLMAALSGEGAMALLGLDADAAQELIADYDDLTIAVYASPRQTVIAGPPDQVDAAIARVAATDRLARRVDVDVASHHRIIDPVLPALREALADLSPRTPQIPLLSTADPAGTVSPVVDAQYWCANLRNPVRFSQIVTAAGEQYGTFIEMSPHPVLTYALDDTLSDVHHHSLGTLYRDTDDLVTFTTNLVAASGNRPPTVPKADGFVALPHTPWHHSRFWVKVPEESPVPVSAAAPATGAPVASGGHGVLDDWLLELDWRERGLPGAATDQPERTWVVVSDDPAAAELASALGGTTVVVAEDLGAHSDALAGATDVLYAPAYNTATAFSAQTVRRIFRIARGLAKALVAASGSPRLHIATRNAQPVSEGEAADPSQALLWGFGRTLAIERPEIWGGIVDVDATLPAQLLASIVRAESAADDADDQVVYRAGRRLVPRLRHAPAPQPLTGLPADGAQLVIGATGNVGPDLVRQLAAMGAGTIVAVSRRGGDGLASLTAELATTGTTLVTYAADAADPAAMAELFARFGTDLPRLDGVYVAALAGGAGELVDLTDDDVEVMFRPKVDAVEIAHRLTLATPVRQFVLFSSITGLLGSRWLGHYTAANAYADAVAFARRSMGLAATVIDWGLWKSWADAQPDTASAGLTPMPNDVAIATLPTLLSPDAGVRAIMVGADWEQLAQAYRMRTSFTIVDVLLGAADTDDTAGVSAARAGTLLGDQIDGGVGLVFHARIAPDELPYPGPHIVQGVQVVPASVLLSTVAEVAREFGASGVGDISFQYPVVVDRPRVIAVSVFGDGAITIASATSPSAPPERWIEHVSATATDAELAAPGPATTDGVVGFETSDAEDLQRRWGIDGRPYPWDVRTHSTAPGALQADVDLTAPSSAGWIDAAVHLARLLDSADDGLMFPSAVGAIQIHAGSSGAAASSSSAGVIELRHRGSDASGFASDVVIAGPDGDRVLDIRGLRFARAGVPQLPESPDAATTDADVLAWAQLSAEATRLELRERLRAIVAREIGMPPEALRINQSFPELGLDSMMAMAVLRDARRLVGIDLSATMLWNHPTVEALSDLLTELLAPQREAAQSEPESDESDGVESVLDSLFDSVESLSDDPLADAESVSAVSESGDR
ncbi:MAG: type I polyketide synthase [Gordonia sp. (in: high G+C Gram-positive bacteria)]